jgi:hypothetical protein
VRRSLRLLSVPSLKQTSFILSDQCRRPRRATGKDSPKAIESEKSSETSREKPKVSLEKAPNSFQVNPGGGWVKSSVLIAMLKVRSELDQVSLGSKQSNPQSREKQVDTRKCGLTCTSDQDIILRFFFLPRTAPDWPWRNRKLSRYLRRMVRDSTTDSWS